jgi:hypothetical protein
MDKYKEPGDILRMGHQLVLDFLNRRKETVIQALLEMRPDFVQEFQMEGTFDVPDLQNKVKMFRQAYEKGDVKFKGIWRDIWQYNLHGTGCELISIKTAEYFDWDIGDSNLFFTGEFYRHLEWRCRNEAENTTIKSYLAWLQQHKGTHDILLDKPAKSRVIEQKGTHEWLLQPGYTS